MTRNFVKLISSYPKLLEGLALLMIVFGVILISKCESDKQTAAQQSTEHNIFIADSLIASQQGIISVYKKQSSIAQDSIDYWKKQYKQASTQQKQVIILHEKIKTTYARDFATNPDSARLGFLTKRFPNLYPKASARRIDK